MLVLQCVIEIENKDNQKIKITGVNEIEVLSSVRSLTDTAKITLPKKVKFEGTAIDELIKRGDKITIYTGYEDFELQKIFFGYVKSVSSATQVVVGCENEMWLLKQIKVTPKTYKKFDLKQFLTEYNVDCNILEKIEFGEVIIKEETTVTKVLDYLTSKYPFKIYYNNDGVLSAMLSNINAKSAVIILDRDVNVVSDQLAYTSAQDVNIIVKAKAILSDNKQLEAQAPKDGKDGEVRTFYAPQYKTKEELQQFADDKLKEFKIDKMTGTVMLFGVPHVKKGDVVKLRYVDDVIKDNKKFIVDSVKYNFGQNGYRQELTLGYEIK